MHLHKFFSRIVALGACVALAHAADECPDGRTIVQETPVEIISYAPSTTHTSYTTITRVIIVPPGIPSDPPQTTGIEPQTTGSPPIITTTVPYNRTTPSTTTIPPSGSVPGTVIVYVPPTSRPPSPITTISTPWTGSTPSSTTVPGTVIVYIPRTSDPSIPPVTTTTPWTGTTPSTTTVPGTGTTPPSVIVYVPSTSVPPVPPVTTTTPWTGSTPSTTTVPGTGTVPTSVIVYVPSTSIPPVTTTTPWTGSTPSSTTIPGTGTVPPSVIVYVPTSSPVPTSSSISPSPTSTPSSSSSSSPSSTAPTSSSTSPVPSGACTVADTGACSPSGLTVQLYANNASYISGYGVTGSTDQGVGPDYYLTQEPLDQGSSQSLSVPNSNPPYDQPSSKPYETEGHTSFNYYGGYTQTYAGMTYDANNFTLVFTGYYMPAQTGTYTFCVHADNRDAFYIGSGSAFPCGDASNGATPTGSTPLVEYFFDKTDGSNVCKTIDLTAGYYYPVRSVYGNWGPPSSLDLTVQPPGGDATSDVTGEAYPNTCSAQA